MYKVEVDKESQKKQKDFSAGCHSRGHNILDTLTSSDVRVLVKTCEEFSQTRVFSRVFPTRTSHSYFKYFDSVSYYDKLLYAFLAKYSDNYEEGLKYINSYCKAKIHLKSN